MSASDVEDSDRDDDRTGIAISSIRGASLPPTPLPAAGRPASIPPPARSHRPPTIRPMTTSGTGPSSIRPPPSSARAHARDDDDDAEDDDGGRTVVRDPSTNSGNRVVRRSVAPKPSTPSSNPTSISPAAVIRKTQQSARAQHLLTPPPSDLMDGENDSDEYTQAAPSAPARSARQTEDLPSTGSRRAYDPPTYEGPPSHRPPPESYRRNDGFDGPPSPRSYAPPPMSSTPGHFVQPSSPPSNPYSMQQTQQSMSAPNPYGATVPATAAMQAPHSMPPGMMPPAQSSRPGAMMGGMGTAQMQAQNHNAQNNNAMMPAHFRMAQTGAIAGPMGGAGAALVTPLDPPGTAITAHTRVSGRPGISWAAALAAAGVFVGVVAVAIAQRGDAVADTQASFVDPSHTGKAAGGQVDQTTAPPQPVAAPTQAQPGPNALPPGLIGASPIQPVAPIQVATATTAPPAATTGPAPVPGMADPSLGLAAPTASAPAMTFPPAAVPSAKVAAAPPRAPAWHPPPRRPVAAATDDDDDDAPAAKPAPKPTASGKKPGKGNDADAETKAALEALQKAQLESSSSFSK